MQLVFIKSACSSQFNESDAVGTQTSPGKSKWFMPPIFQRIATSFSFVRFDFTPLRCFGANFSARCRHEFVFSFLNSRMPKGGLFPFSGAGTLNVGRWWWPITCSSLGRPTSCLRPTLFAGHGGKALSLVYGKPFVEASVHLGLPEDNDPGSSSNHLAQTLWRRAPVDRACS